MSDAVQTQTKKEAAGNGTAKAKAEKEPRQLQTFATLGADFTGPAPDESLTDGSADGWNSGTSSVLSHEPSTLLMRRISPGRIEGTKPAGPSVVVPTFGGRNFCNIPTHASTRPAVQPKLTVGAAHDPSEQEADDVADQVMRMPAPVSAPPSGADAPEPGGNPIQRAPEEEEEIQTKPLAATIRPFVQRTDQPHPPAPSPEIDPAKKRGAGKMISGEGEQPTPLSNRLLLSIGEGSGVRQAEDELQTKRVSAADSFEVGSDFENRVAGSGGGSPLPAETRTFMEPRFGADFSGVRLHAGGEAADLNRQVSAQAFTLGRDIYLGEGKTDVASDGGKRLIAHELTHVVQQGGAVRREVKVKGEETTSACCEEGKKIAGQAPNYWTPQKAQKAFDDKKAETVTVNISSRGKKKDGSLGPTNTVTGKLAGLAVDLLDILLEDASAAGVHVWCAGGQSMFRDLKGQWDMFHYRSHSMTKKKVAWPGTSNHGTGEAIDFKSDDNFAWLKKNASKYGWKKLSTEDWHYDYTPTADILTKYSVRINKKKIQKSVENIVKAVFTPQPSRAELQKYADEIFKAVIAWRKRNPQVSWREVLEYVVEVTKSVIPAQKNRSKVSWHEILNNMVKVVSALVVAQKSNPEAKWSEILKSLVKITVAAAQGSAERKPHGKAEASKPAQKTSIQHVQAKEDERQIRRAASSEGFEADGDVEGRISRMKGGGNPLPDETRTFMEPRFGADFSGVRVHAGSEAADLNRQVSAQAFTLGRDIYLGEGQTDVASDGGKRLLAHELTHVVQQGGAGQLQRSWIGLLQRDGAPAAETTVPTESEKAAAQANAKAAKERAAAAREKARARQAQEKAEADAKREAGKAPSQKVAASIAVGPVNSQAKEALQAASSEKAKQAAEEHAAKTQVTKAATNAATATAQSALTDARAAAPKGGSLPKAAAGDKSSGNGSGGVAAIAAAHTTVEGAMTPKNLGPQTPTQDAGYQTVIKTVNTVSKEQQTHKPAQSEASAAQAAVVQPAAEVTGLAEANQVGKMERTETPGFDAAGFKAKLMERIAALAPKSSQEADEFKEKGAAGALTGELQTQTGQERDKSTTPLEQTTAAAPDTSSITPKPVTPLPPAEPGQVPGAVGAENATPKPKASAEVEQPLQQSSQAVDAEMTQAGVTEEQLANSNEPQFTAALDSKNQAQSQIQEAPAAYRQGEQGQINSAETAATAVAQEKMQAMNTDRGALLNQVTGKQTDAKTQDEQARSKVAADIQKIYEESKGKVETILSGLDTKVSAVFDAGAQAAKQAFEDYVDARMNAYKEERYGGLLGWAQWLADKIMGMPGEVNTFYAEGRQLYLDQMNTVIDNVVSIIGTTLAEAKAEIALGKKNIQEYVAKLPEDLKQVGQDAAQNIQSQFDTLEQSVNDKQNELIDTLANKYQENLQAIDARITEMKAANKGLVDAIIEAVGGVIKMIIDLKNMLMNILARAAAAIEMIIKDPIGFLSHLVDAVKLGVQNFLANIGTHLQKGLLAWLTGTIAEAGITLPEKFDLPGIFQLVLQVLGLSMDKIRARVTGLLGFDLFGIIDKVVEIVKVVQTDGLEGLVKYGLAQLLGQEGANVLVEVVGTFQAVLSGDFSKLWELFQKHLGDLQALVLDQIKNFVIEKIITAGITWVISLLNPAGAFIRACKAIYDIVMFFVEHGQQIIALVNAVIDSITAIASGNIAGAAKFVEDALAKAIPVTIGFLASLLGLGDIGSKVQEIIKKIQGLVDSALDAIFNSGPVQMVANFIKKIINKIKGGLASLKDKVFGKKPGEIGKTVTFSDGKESHKLWVAVQGTSATLMMASKDPKGVKEWVADWRSRLGELSAEKQATAQSLLDEVDPLSTEIDQNADAMASSNNSASTSGDSGNGANDNNSDAKDEVVERDEDTMAPKLKQLFEIFESTPVKAGIYKELLDTQAKGRQEAHHVPPKFLLEWVVEQSKSVNEKIKGMEEDPIVGDAIKTNKPAYEWAAKLAKTPRTTFNPGDNLAAISINKYTHIKTTGVSAIDSWRIHWGPETAKKVLSDLNGKGLRLIFKKKFYQLSPEDRQKYLDLAKKSGEKIELPTAAEEPEAQDQMLSTQFFATELNAALEEEKRVTGEDISGAKTSISNVAKGAAVQARAAVGVVLQNSSIDGSSDEKQSELAKLDGLSTTTWNAVDGVSELGIV